MVEPSELEQRALEMAAEIGANAPLSQSGNKRMLRTLRAARAQAQTPQAA